MTMIGTRDKQAALCDLCTTACCSVQGSHRFIQSGYVSNNLYICVHCEAKLHL
jgi:hypothetical protein